MQKHSAVFENMADDWYHSGDHKYRWYKFAPAWCAIQAQDMVADYPSNNAAKQQTLKWWNEAVKHGFVDC